MYLGSEIFIRSLAFVLDRLDGMFDGRVGLAPHRLQESSALLLHVGDPLAILRLQLYAAPFRILVDFKLKLVAEAVSRVQLVQPLFDELECANRR